MTGLPEPKFSIGQEVFTATIQRKDEKMDCPDCLGEKEWTWRSPAGAEGKFSCARCKGHGNLSLYAYGPWVQAVTLGFVRVETATTHREARVEYMTSRTGSGTIYSEERLFPDHEQASVAARALANKANNKLDKKDTSRNKFRALSEYQIQNTMIKEAEDRAWNAEYKVKQLLTAICGLEPDFIHGGGRYNSSATLTEKQARAVQENIVWLWEWAADFLDNWRAEDDD